MEDFKSLFESLGSLKIGVVGDVMLDTYMWGRVDRISPEAPVPIVSLTSQEMRVGGAGNVALNARSLGANVSVLSVIGNDEYGAELEQLFNGNGINTVFMVKSDQRITTNKIRVISRNQQMMRLDTEMTDDLTLADEKKLIEKAKSYIANEKPDVIIFEDYNKGTLTQNLINEIISLCKQSKVLTAVDPKNRNFFSFRGVDIFKPNLKEVKEALSMYFEDPDEKLLGEIHLKLVEKTGHAISLITLSDKGVFYRKDERSSIIPSHLRSIADVSGAGDTVIAVASLVYAATGNVHLMAEIANIAGGMVCEEVGTVAINREKLLHECELLLS
jgi:D-glycero-beta-D-manno-heptose-7-phosphate kinase